MKINLPNKKDLRFKETVAAKLQFEFENAVESYLNHIGTMIKKGLGVSNTTGILKRTISRDAKFQDEVIRILGTLGYTAYITTETVHMPRGGRNKVTNNILNEEKTPRAVLNVELF